MKQTKRKKRTKRTNKQKGGELKELSSPNLPGGDKNNFKIITDKPKLKYLIILMANVQKVFDFFQNQKYHSFIMIGVNLNFSHQRKLIFWE